ncbi:MAG: hypothetical protein HRT73_06320, partial [Flavobacteriales bacterium]|nr:hypothetical protein [Flavobacteriales bacterium]
MLNNKPISYKRIFLLFFIFCFTSSFGQKKYEPTYQKVFKQVKKITYNNNLIKLSEVKPDKKWNNYKGGAINTIDSLFFFDNKFLGLSFPTNSDKIRNEYLAFYFSQKTAKSPTLFSLLNYYRPIIKQNLTTNNLPKELELLPVVL